MIGVLVLSEACTSRRESGPVPCEHAPAAIRCRVGCRLPQTSAVVEDLRLARLILLDARRGVPSLGATAVCHLGELIPPAHQCIRRVGWLTTTPASPDTHIPSHLFRTALRRRLRMPIWDGDTACGLCGEVLDRWGDHAICCSGGGDRVLRHNAVRNVVCSGVSEFSSVAPELEKRWSLTSSQAP